MSTEYVVLYFPINSVDKKANSIRSNDIVSPNFVDFLEKPGAGGVSRTHLESLQAGFRVLKIHQKLLLDIIRWRWASSHKDQLEMDNDPADRIHSWWRGLFTKWIRNWKRHLKAP